METPQGVAEIAYSWGVGLRVELVGGYLVVQLKHDAIPGEPWLDLSMESDGTVRLLGLLVAYTSDSFFHVVFQ